ncbi:hypothetical protein D3C72_1917300 [compost metagenome]
MHRQPVLQAMHAAGVFRHVAADGAGDLAGRIRRVVQPIRRRGLGDRQVAHPRFHDGRGAGQIDMLDAVEFGQPQQHSLAVRHGAARQSRARATRDDGRVQPLADAHDGLHLLFGFRQGDDRGKGAVKG